MEKENGVPAPNYTQTPNALFALLPVMHEAEIKVTLAIARKTFGWHKERDMLSLSQLEGLTGLSRQGVIDGIEKGIERGTIERIPHGQSFDYSIVVRAVDQSELVKPVDHQVVKPVDQLLPELVKPVDTQKKEILNKELKKIKSGAKIAPPPESASAEQKGVSLDKGSPLAINGKLPDAPVVVQAKRRIGEILDAAGVLRPEIADPRKARKTFVREYEGRFAAIVKHAAPTTTDRAATGKAFDLKFDPDWLDERLSAYTNGEGAEFRKPGANGYWIVNKLEEDRARGTLKRQGAIDDDYRKYVHGTAEHEEYRKVYGCDLCDRADAADELERGAGDAEMAG